MGYKADNQYTPDWANAQYVTYTATPGLSAVMPVGFYSLRPSTDCWVKAGAAAPVASVGAGSIFVKAGEDFRFVNPNATYKVSVIQASSGGAFSLVKLV